MKKIRLIFIFLFIILIISISVFLRIYINNGNETASIKLYQDLINKILNNKDTNTFTFNFISIYTNSLIDLLTNKQLSDNSKNEILNYCKKYNNTVYDKNSEQLNNNPNEGLIITIPINKKNRNTVNILVNYYTSNFGNGRNGYNCNFTHNVWNITDISTSWSS